jgi:hypothetical protein
MSATAVGRATFHRTFNHTSISGLSSIVVRNAGSRIRTFHRRKDFSEGSMLAFAEH